MFSKKRASNFRPGGQGMGGSYPSMNTGYGSQAQTIQMSNMSSGYNGNGGMDGGMSQPLLGNKSGRANFETEVQIGNNVINDPTYMAATGMSGIQAKMASAGQQMFASNG